MIFLVFPLCLCYNTRENKAYRKVRKKQEDA